MSTPTTVAALAWARGEQAADGRGSASPEKAVMIIDVVGMTLGAFALWVLGVA